MKTLNKYQDKALRTAQTPATDNSHIYNYLLGLSGETGEVCDYLKKVYFHGHKLDEQQVCDELGDVLWYIAVLADSFGLSLRMVAEANIEKLKERYPDGFDPERSKNRKPGAK